jgi:hypothetical protein
MQLEKEIEKRRASLSLPLRMQRVGFSLCERQLQRVHFFINGIRGECAIHGAVETHSGVYMEMPERGGLYRSQPFPTVSATPTKGKQSLIYFFFVRCEPFQIAQKFAFSHFKTRSAGFARIEPTRSSKSFNPFSGCRV